MAKFVKISTDSSDLIAQLVSIMDDSQSKKWTDRVENGWEQTDLILWLEKQLICRNEQSRLLIESLRASLLDDLQQSFERFDKQPDKINKTKPSWLTRLKFKLLILAGGLLAICGGFSSITSTLRMFLVPTVIVMGVGILFAGLSLAFFYKFDRVEMSNIFGTRLKQSNELLDVCLNQIDKIKQLRKYIDASYVKIADPIELQELRAIVIMLNTRYKELDDVRNAYLTKLKNPYFKAVKRSIGLLEGGLAWIGGFFAGQYYALAAAKLFVATGVLATSWPVIVASIIFSVAAFSVYWILRRKGYEHRIGSVLGIDTTKIESFAGGTVVTRQKEKLDLLASKLAEKISSLQHIAQLHTTLKGYERLDQGHKTDIIQTSPLVDGAKSSQGFFKRSRSMPELSQRCVLANVVPSM